MALKFREATHLSSRDDACNALCDCAPRGQPLSRRGFLCSAAAAGLGGALSASRAQAPAADVKMAAGTIDVHHHYFPPATQEATFKMLTGVFGDVPERIRNWSPARAVDELDRNGIAKARRGHVAGDRICVRCPEGARRRHDDQLRRSMAGGLPNWIKAQCDFHFRLLSRSRR
jgi:hypothetical protein